MEIKTRFNIGDKIFILNYANEIEEHPIDYIKVFSDGVYYKCGYGYTNSYNDNSEDIFRTKEEAVKESVKRHIEKLEQIKNEDEI